MNRAIGQTYLLNFIILFILIFFAFIIGTLSYYKAFKVNNRIIYALEKFEGYNELSKSEIDGIVKGLGYASYNSKCDSSYKGMSLVDSNSKTYCIYIDNPSPSNGSIYNYAVLTYMYIDLPLINRINIPVFTRANRLYKFA